MTDLADFLRARIAERRAIAEAAAALQDDPENGWGLIDHSGYAQTEKRRWISPHIGMLHEVQSAERVVANNPAVVLADLDAKLAIVNRHTACGTGNGYCDDGGHGWDDIEGGGCADLADLARPFAGHTDYQEGWAA